MPAPSTSLVQIWDQIVGYDGLPVSGRQVTVQQTYAGVATYSGSTPYELFSYPIQSVVTDQNGYWTLNVIPNDLVVPSGTAYQVRPEGGFAYTISVPSGSVPAGGWKTTNIITSSSPVGPFQPVSLAFATVAQQGDIYVAPWGNDNNAGNSPLGAFATVSAALAAVGNVGRIFFLPNPSGNGAIYDIGTPASATTGLVLPQAVHLIGAGWTKTILRYLGTGVAVQTAKTAGDQWAVGLIQDLGIINGGGGTIGLDVRNPQNGAAVRRVRVGNTAEPNHNFSSRACLVESTLSSASFPGFFKMVDCWFIGGATVCEVQTGVTTIILDNCGIDTDANSTIGFDNTANPVGGTNGTDLLLQGCKMELTTGPSSGGSPALAGAGAGNVDNGSHVYATSFVLPQGETIPSVNSAAVTVADKTVNGQVTLSSIPVGAGNNKYAAARKIYRSAAGTTAPLLLVGTISDNTTTTFADNVADASLGPVAAGTVGDATGWQFDADCHIQGFIDARHTAVSSKAAVNYTATPTGPPYPRMRITLTSLNFTKRFVAPNLTDLANFQSVENQNAIFTDTLDFGGETFPVRAHLAGKAVGTSNFALSGMGTGAAVALSPGGGILHKDQAWGITLTVGTTPSASPTITFTPADGSWNSAPRFVIIRNGGTGALGFTWLEASNAVTLTLTGTPTAGETYTFRAVGWAV